MNGSAGSRRLTLGHVLPSATLVAEMAVSAPTEADGFPAIYEQHLPFVWRCLRGLGVAPAQLDDAAQDVFVLVHQRLSTFRRESSLRTWIFGIARRVAFRYRRTAARKGGLPPPERETAAPGPGPLERAQDLEAAAFVARFVEGLDDRKREVFVLGVLEEMTVPEIAEALRVPLNTAYTRLRRARAEFRRALGDRSGGS